jgi:hypothetical protein
LTFGSVSPPDPLTHFPSIKLRYSVISKGLVPPLRR